MAAGMAVGAGLSAFGNIYQGQQTAAALTGQADLQIKNAQEAEAEGKLSVDKQQMVFGQRVGSAVASYGAAGVTATSGSALNILASSTANSEMDRLNILHGADLKAIQFENQASMERAGASSAITGSYFGALAGGASAGSKIYGNSLGAGDGSSSSSGGGNYAGSDSYGMYGADPNNLGWIKGGYQAGGYSYA